MSKTTITVIGLIVLVVNIIFLTSYFIWVYKILKIRRREKKTNKNSQQ